ncbi:LOW QUALITY PROTEIN: Hypothetical protein PHPALM_6260 [Phytophthora palmivora]|uniref:Integrase zinc-binding domain-containing protein n=1 Tax=Phytophthora palmivora TaxID=4796 RepID=A0A2P4YFM1_9STRA|nr:LOW QUALITY PROTEIN: Hypothetical protein PHPALM_6260 [Phytophthora palmivora]
MARWLSFFAEYNFRVEYKPGKLNVLADALPRRRDYDLAHVSRFTTDLYDRIRLAYQGDENYTPLVQFLSDGKTTKVDRLSSQQRVQLHRFELTDGLLHYRVDPGDPPRVVVPNDEDLKYEILLEAHDAPMSGHLDREKTYQMVSQTFWWPTPLVQFLSDGKTTKVDRLSSQQRVQLHRFELTDGLLHYRVDPGDPPRVVVPNDEDLKYEILLEAHDAPMSGHLDRERRLTKWSLRHFGGPACTSGWHTMSRYAKHRVKPSGHASAPLQSLPVPADCWKSMRLDFVFSLPADDTGNTGILVFVCRLSKIVHLAPVRDKVTGNRLHSRSNIACFAIMVCPRP